MCGAQGVLRDIGEYVAFVFVLLAGKHMGNRKMGATLLQAMIEILIL